MPNSINIKIKEINFCNKKPFTIVFSSNSIINVELWLEDYKFLNIVNSFGENLFENFYDYFNNNFEKSHWSFSDWVVHNSIISSLEAIILLLHERTNLE